MFYKVKNIINNLKRQKFAYINAEEVFVKASFINDWNLLRNSWNYLTNDKYMKNDDSYRKRAIGKFLYDTEIRSLSLLDDTTFYQKREINSYVGGVERTFSPMSHNVASNLILHELIKISLDIFLEYKFINNRYWNVYVHQFRIEARNGILGNPSPEGIHRDGHTFISMHMINKVNVLGGVSKIYDKNKIGIKEVTLSKPLESILLDDNEMFHDVSPIELKSDSYGFRDVMVIDYNEVTNV